MRNALLARTGDMFSVARDRGGAEVRDWSGLLGDRAGFTALADRYGAIAWDNPSGALPITETHTPLRAWSGAAAFDDSQNFGGCRCMACAISKNVDLKSFEGTAFSQTSAPSPNTPQFLGDDIPDGITSTVRMNVGQTFASSIQSVGDVDYIRIAVVAGQTYTISLETTASGGLDDPLMQVRSTADAVLAEDDDGGIQFNSFLRFTATTTGDVFIVAQSWDNQFTGNYTITVNTLVTGNTSPTQFIDTGKPYFSWDEAAIQLTRTGSSWAPAFGTATTVTYAYRDTGGTLPSDISGFQQFNSNQIEATEAALRAWMDVANIVFQRVGSGTSGPGAYSNNATILIGGYTSGAAGAAAFAFLPSTADRTAGDVEGDIWVNLTQSANATMTYGGYGPHTMLHEIGHAIGISHPSNYNASENASPNYVTNAAYFSDSRMFTAMSYFGSSQTGGNLALFSAAPQLHDIAAAQRLYGANMTTRTGDNIYGFNSNAGVQQFVATAGAGIVFAVWDAGGNDTFDFSGYSQNAVIDLREEAFSSVGPGNVAGQTAVHNVAIARGVVIENAIGGGGDDLLRGNSAANQLTGGLGADQLFGLEGADTLRGGDGADFLVGGLGADSIFGDGNGDIILVNSADEASGDSYDGGLGFDELRFDFSAATVGNVTLVIGNNAITSIETITFRAGNVTGAGWTVFGVDISEVMTGGSGRDAFVGAGGADRLEGLGDRDELFGGAGFDTLLGGDGDDFAFGGDDNDSIEGGAGGDWLQADGGEDTVFGGLGRDSIQGGDGADRLEGGDEDDQMFGDGGADALLGDGGDDIMFGRTENDTLLGGEGNDWVQGNEGNDSVNGGNGIDIVIGDEGDDFLVGGAGVDTIVGGSGEDTLQSDDGDDTSVGREGNDTIFGGAGNDWLMGDEGNDELNGDQDNDTLIGGDGNDTIRGGTGNEIILGGSGNDRIFGDDGDDLFWAQGGNDTITGGAGTDIFQFNFEEMTAGQVDVITDYNVAQDRFSFVRVDPSRVTVIQSGADVIVRVALDGGGFAEIIVQNATASAIAGEFEHFF